MAKTTRQDEDDNRIVVSADGRLCVSGAARSRLVAALTRMRALPAAVTDLLGDFQATVVVLESALASPVPLEVSNYYELVASFEEAMAQAMQLLLDMAPPDEESPHILATLHLALARSQCFRHFAKAPGDDASAREYLLAASGLHVALEGSLRTQDTCVLPAEGEALASTLRSMAGKFGSVDSELAQGAIELATQLSSARRLSLCTFFEQHAEVYECLSRFFMRTLFVHRVMPADVGPAAPPNVEEELQARGVQYAMAAAACSLLVGFFTPRPAGSSANEPRLILN